MRHFQGLPQELCSEERHNDVPHFVCSTRDMAQHYVAWLVCCPPLWLYILWLESIFWMQEFKCFPVLIVQ